MQTNIYYYIFAIITFRLNILLVTNAIHTKFRANYQRVEPCPMLSEKSLLLYRIWDRPCKVRRFGFNIDIKEVSSRERGPPKSDNYNPTYGFEPYWEWGDWVFDKIKNPLGKGEENMCGERCPVMFKGFGTICAMDKNLKRYTYNSYCEMRNADCTNERGLKMIYREGCWGGILTYPTKSDNAFDIDSHIAEYYRRSPTTMFTTPRFWGKK